MASPGNHHYRQTRNIDCSAIHGVFPKVTSLDGIPVQRSSVSEIPDLDDFPKVPPSRPGFYSSDELRVLLETFIIEYMKLYDDPDTNNRKNLINAYEENATFSLTCENLPDANEKRPFTEQKTYVTYRRASHNILETERWKYYRDKRLQKGAMEIVVELRNLPATTHLMDTFLVDVSMVTARYIAFAVQGFFRDNVDRVTNKDEVKYFCRNFIVLNKEGGKLAIVSDMLFISGVFAERVQRYKTMLSAWLKAPPSVKQEQVEQPSVSSGIGGLNIADQPSTSGTSSAGNPAPLTPAQIAAAGDVHMQQQMIDAFSKESGMKPEWCRKCLEDQNWEYEVAGQVFLAVRDKIPAEAFL